MINKKRVKIIEVEDRKQLEQELSEFINKYIIEDIKLTVKGKMYVALVIYI